MSAERRRTIVFAVVFWAAALAFVTVDWKLSAGYNRFDEPPPWQLGQERSAEAGHCAAPLK